jgi:hypothetical protein
LEDLLVMDSLRGTDSTGIAVVNNKEKIITNKKAVNGLEFTDFRDVDNLISSNRNRLIIGHNRFATQGAVNNVNAHPFTHGNITGAHNGTLRWQDALCDSDKFEVDSENIVHSLNKVGPQATFDNLYGAFALSWWDEEEKRLKFMRNDERDLHYTFANKGKTLVWASEPYMLQAALSRRGVAHGDVIQFNTNMLYTFDLEIGRVFEPELKKPVVRSLGKPPVRMLPPPRMRHIGPVGSIGKTDSQAYLKSLGYTLASKVEFAIVDVKWGVAIGLTLDEHNETIQIPCSVQSRLETLQDHTGYFESDGIVGFKRDTGLNDGYLTISINKLTKLEYQEEEDVDFLLTDWRGNVLTQRAFQQQYNMGCMVCADPFDINSSDYILTGHSVGVCGSCKDLDIAKAYVNAN